MKCEQKVEVRFAFSSRPLPSTQENGTLFFFYDYYLFINLKLITAIRANFNGSENIFFRDCQYILMFDTTLYCFSIVSKYNRNTTWLSCIINTIFDFL